MPALTGFALRPDSLASIRPDAVETLRTVRGLRVGELELAGGCDAYECHQRSFLSLVVHADYAFEAVKGTTPPEKNQLS